jgi:hypothetical protein
LTPTSQKAKLVVKGQQVNVALNRSDNKQLYLTNVHEAATRDDIEEAIDDVLPSVFVTEVVIPSKYELPPESENICQIIDNEVHKIMTQQSLHCVVSPSVLGSLKDKTVRGRATVGFSDLNCAIDVAAAINANLVIENERAEVYLEPSMVFIRQDVYRVVKQELITLLSRQRTTLAAQGIKVSKYRTKADDMQIDISGRHPNDTVDIRSHITKLISPLVYQVNLVFFQILKSQGGESFLKSLGKCNAYAELDKFLWTVNIFGNESSKNEALRQLKQYELTTSQAETREFNLQGTNMPRGLMKDFLNHYKCDVEMIRVDIGAFYCSLNIRKQILTVCGPAESLRRVDQVLSQRASMLAPSIRLPTSSSTASPTICPICMTDIQADRIHYLELCGHAYCQECLGLALQNAVSNKELPITCCYDQCGVLLSMDDILSLLWL